MLIGIAGDVSFSHHIGRSVARNPDYEPLAALAGMAAHLDAFAINLESPFCCKGKPIGLQATCSGLAVSEHLASVSVTHVNLANNHANDGGAFQLNATAEELSSHGLLPFGITGYEYAKSRGGVGCEGVVFVGLTCYPIWPTMQSVEPVSLYGPRLAKCLSRIKALAERNSVIVSMHGDIEFSKLPSPERLSLCRSVVDAGARVVFCHHPHNIQGYEKYDEGLIFYSLGNLLFNCYSSELQFRNLPQSSIGMLPIISLTERAVELKELLITQIINQNEPKVEILSGVRRAEVLTDVARLSEILDNPEVLLQNWRALQFDQAENLVSDLGAGTMRHDELMNNLWR